MKLQKSLIKRFKPLLITLLVLALVIAVATPTIAYFIKTAGKVEGEYTPAKPSDPTYDPPVRLSFQLRSDDKEMKDVYIFVPDQGYPVFVRVEVVITWIRLTDCTCTPRRCNSCTCEDCENCEDCSECPGCDDCDGCENSTDCKNCPDCKEGECTDCENCADCNGCEKVTDCENCPDCKEGECTDCENCVDCSGCKNCLGCEKCEDCKNCENCLDRDECPRCNDDPNDDWDVFFALPEEDKDYALTLGGGWERYGEGAERRYYYTNPVISNGTANPSRQIKIEPPVIKELALTASKPPMENCILNVELIVQTIQAIGFTDYPDADGNEIPAWKDAWENAPYSNP